MSPTHICVSSRLWYKHICLEKIRGPGTTHGGVTCGKIFSAEMSSINLTYSTVGNKKLLHFCKKESNYNTRHRQLRASETIHTRGGTEWLRKLNEEVRERSDFKNAVKYHHNIWLTFLLSSMLASAIPTKSRFCEGY